MSHKVPVALPESWLATLITELDGEDVRAIILHGSYARGDATPPYSDIDIVRVMQETPERTQEKRFHWYDGYLLNLSSRPLSIYQEWLTTPQNAIFRVSTIQEARILLDKDGAFHDFQQNIIHHWTWNALQKAADAYASKLLTLKTEIAHKILRAIFLQDEVALSEMLLDMLDALTEAIAVQKGILIKGGNTYFRQVQEHIGIASPWTLAHRTVAGLGTRTDLLARGTAALHLYQETVKLLHSYLSVEDRTVIEQTISVIEQALQSKQFG